MHNLLKSTSDTNRVPNITANMLADAWNLTPQHSNGKTTFHGPNPFPGYEPGTDRFVLFPELNALDNKAGKKFSSREVIGLFSGAVGVGQNPSDRQKIERKAKAKFQWNKPFEVYSFVDEARTLLFEVCRQGHGADKCIAQRRPRPDPGPTEREKWLYSLGDTRRVLFFLPCVLEADTVLIVEGEKAADFIQTALWEQTYTPAVAATCNPHGAGKWRAEYNECLKGKSVYIIPDADEPGAAHAIDVATQLANVARDIRIVELPEQQAKAGADDWIARGHTIDELLNIARSAPLFEVSSTKEEAAATDEFSLDDIGNGQRFAEMHCGDLRYCSTRDRWIVWQGGVWDADLRGAAELRAKATARATFAKAQELTDSESRFKLQRHAQTLFKRATRATMIADAASEPGMMVTLGMFDQDTNLFNCANGTLELSTNTFREHRAADFLSLQSSVVYDKDAKCDLWRACVERWIPDAATRVYLQDSIGLTLHGDVFEEFFIFLLGDGNNGKSKFLGALEKLLGSYGHKTQAETLMVARSPRAGKDASPEILSLRGARMVSAHEIDSHHKVSSVVLKDITGRDSITARGVYERQSTTFTPQFTLWLVGNSKPTITDTSGGMWRRPRIIEFGEPIAPHERDYQLAQKIEAELPGILNWAVEGLLRVKNRGIVIPDAVSAATASYRAEQDPLGLFLSECCEMGPKLTTVAKDLYGAWETWCDDNAESPRSPRSFGMELERRKCEKFSGTYGRMWRGISLKQKLSEIASVASVASVHVEQPTQPTQPTLFPITSADNKTTNRKGKANNAESEFYGAE